MKSQCSGQIDYSKGNRTLSFNPVDSSQNILKWRMPTFAGEEGGSPYEDYQSRLLGWDPFLCLACSGALAPWLLARVHIQRLRLFNIMGFRPDDVAE